MSRLSCTSPLSFISGLSWHDPAPILRAGSLGILGASPKSPWVPILTEQITAAGFAGPLYLINPAHRKIGERPCYPSVRDCPGLPEHLLVLLPAEAALSSLADAAALGVKSATLYSTGWAEADEAGAERQRRLGELVAASGLSLCGPNCLGTISVREGLIQYPLRVAEWLRAGNVGAIFQSGALLYPYLRAAGERGTGFSYVASCGNEVGAGVADYLKFMVEDEHTRVIVLLLEGLKQPEKFVAALEMAETAGKAVAILKVGRSERAAQSTLTHTGALAGSSRVFDALCERHGVAICDSLDDLVETGRLLAVSPRPRGQRAACLVFSGSLRSYLLDHVEENGMTLAEPAPATMEAIAGMAPLDLRIPNPLDCGSLFTQQARYLEIARRLLDDSGVDLLLVEEHAPDPLRNRDPALFKALAGATDKPVVILPETGFSLTPYAREFLASAAIPYAQGVDRGLAAAGNLVRHAAAVRARRLRERAARNPRAFAPGLHGMAQLGDALQDWGIPVSPQGFAEDLSQAEALAGSLGYPLVMKVDSPDIAHKSDAGGVMLGLADEAALRRAWHDIHANVARKAPGARIAGMQLARMAAPGLEMNMGVHRDPQFGLVIMVSLGGVWVEALGDLSLRMLPIDARDAHEMLAELKGAALLGRFRGSAPRDEPALVRALVALSDFAMDHAAQIESIEVNPLLVYEEGQGVLAVDARLVARAG